MFRPKWKAKAIEYYQRAAAKGDMYSVLMLFHRYQIGDITSTLKAEVEFEQQIDRNNSRDLWRLARIYYDRDPSTFDHKLTFELFLKSAERGYAGNKFIFPI